MDSSNHTQQPNKVSQQEETPNKDKTVETNTMGIHRSNRNNKGMDVVCMIPDIAGKSYFNQRTKYKQMLQKKP